MEDNKVERYRNMYAQDSLVFLHLPKPEEAVMTEIQLIENKQMRKSKLMHHHQLGHFLVASQKIMNESIIGECVGLVNEVSDANRLEKERLDLCYD